MRAHSLYRERGGQARKRAAVEPTKAAWSTLRGVHMRENELDTAGFLGECTSDISNNEGAGEPKWALFRGAIPPG